MMKAKSQAAVDRKALCDFPVCAEASRASHPGTPATQLRSQGRHGVQLLHIDLGSPNKHFKEITSILFCSFFWVSTRWLSGHNAYWQFILTENRKNRQSDQIPTQRNSQQLLSEGLGLPSVSQPVKDLGWGRKPPGVQGGPDKCKFSPRRNTLPFGTSIMVLWATLFQMKTKFLNNENCLILELFLSLS